MWGQEISCQPFRVVALVAEAQPHLRQLNPSATMAGPSLSHLSVARLIFACLQTRTVAHGLATLQQCAEPGAFGP